MASIFNIDEWFTELFQDIAKSSVNCFVEAVQEMPEKAEKYLTETPETFSGGTTFSMIRTVSINAIVPVAIIILTMVVCYDFISQFMNRSTRDMDVDVVMKLCFKLGIGIFLLNHVFDLTTGVFELGTSAVNHLVGTLSGDTDFSITSGTFSAIDDKVTELGIGECLLVFVMGIIGYLIQLICNIFVQVICISRMLEIYVYCSISPIPIATLTNREWGGVGTNFIKNLFALAFQAFMMEICIAIFNSMIAGAMSSTAGLIEAMFECLVMGIMLCFTMFRCGTISRSIFGAM